LWDKKSWVLFPDEYFSGCETEIHETTTAPMFSHIESWDYQELSEYNLWSDNDQISKFRVMTSELEINDYK